MNKSYRLVYSIVTNTWVAVSELTKARGKRSGSVVAAAALGTVLLASASAAMGQTYLGTGKYSNAQGTVCSPSTGAAIDPTYIPSPAPLRTQMVAIL